MKKLTTLILLTTILFLNAQKLEKIKGSKNVILSERIFEEINTIKLHKNIQLTLMKGSENKLEIYADDNLHEILESDINNGDLSILLTNRIGSKKKFELTLYLAETTLSKISLHSNSKIENADFLKVVDLQIDLFNKSDANLFLNGNNITININDNSKSNISLKGQKLICNLQENGKIKGNTNFEEIEIKSNQKSTVTLSGKAVNLIIEAKNSSNIKLSNLRVENASLLAENNSNVHVNATNELIIKAESKSKVYIYSDPTIAIESFRNTASLFKR